MREIKFRAWHEKLERMIYDIGVEDEWTDENGKVWSDMKGNLMQFTGLKDKNGKEIYEGDIVRTSLYGQIDCEVVFMKSGFYLLLDTGIGTNLYPMTDVMMEIIGNIYENPELLTPNPKVNKYP